MINALQSGTVFVRLNSMLGRTKKVEMNKKREIGEEGQYEILYD